jgi:hypothetical protein
VFFKGSLSAGSACLMAYCCPCVEFICVCFDCWNKTVLCASQLFVFCILSRSCWILGVGMASGAAARANDDEASCMLYVPWVFFLY